MSYTGMLNAKQEWRTSCLLTGSVRILLPQQEDEPLLRKKNADAPVIKNLKIRSVLRAILSVCREPPGKKRSQKIIYGETLAAPGVASG